jgi:UDP-glucuronate 4-epimerase
MNKKILVTGTAGFIGFHLANKLLERGDSVVGIDNINDYYGPNLKYARLHEAGIDRGKVEWNQEVQSSRFPGYRFIRMDITDKENLLALCAGEKFDYIVHLAAQAGVRYSIENPDAYIQSNLVGFANILETARHNNIKHLVYASSSSVYGMNTQMPFSVHQNVDHPVSLYAATKKSNELMAHTYSHLYGIPTTGLRFFTVYGPWGRPDMAYFLFAEAISKGEPIKVFNHGEMKRDFTYVDDIVESITRLVMKPASPNPSWNGDNPHIPTSSAPYQIFNIGNNNPVQLMDYVKALENALGKEAKKDYMNIQPGDVLATHADATALENYVNFRPQTRVEEGVSP